MAPWRARAALAWALEAEVDAMQWAAREKISTANKQRFAIVSQLPEYLGGQDGEVHKGVLGMLGQIAPGCAGQKLDVENERRSHAEREHALQCMQLVSGDALGRFCASPWREGTCPSVQNGAAQGEKQTIKKVNCRGLFAVACDILDLPSPAEDWPSAPLEGSGQTGDRDVRVCLVGRRSWFQAPSLSPSTRPGTSRTPGALGGRHVGYVPTYLVDTSYHSRRLLATPTRLRYHSTSA